MDVYEARKRNLTGLVKEKSDGNQSAFGLLVGKPASLINRYLKGKQIGTGMARAMESKFNKQKGWMDQDHSAPLPDIKPTKANPNGWAMPYSMPISEMGVRVGRKWQELEEPARGQVLGMIETVLAMQKEHKRPSAKEREDQKRAYDALLGEQS